MRNEIILIPTLNPNQRLTELIEELNAAGFFKIIVVDDGSEKKYRSFFSIYDVYPVILTTSLKYLLKFEMKFSSSELSGISMFFVPKRNRFLVILLYLYGLKMQNHFSSLSKLICLLSA